MSIAQKIDGHIGTWRNNTHGNHIKSLLRNYISGTSCSALLVIIPSAARFETSIWYEVKVKWSRYRPGVAQRLGRGIALLFHDRGTRSGVSGQQHAPAALYPRERPCTRFTGGWVGPRVGLDRRKISSPPEFDPGPSSPVAQSLYRLSYRAHISYELCMIL